MKPDSFLGSDDTHIQFQKSSKNEIILPDEQANGVYGLVITGHSLVRKVQSLVGDEFPEELIRRTYWQSEECFKNSPLEDKKFFPLIED